MQIKHNQLLRKNEDFKLRDSDMQKELEKLIGDFNKIRIDNVKNDEDIIKMNVSKMINLFYYRKILIYAIFRI